MDTLYVFSCFTFISRAGNTESYLNRVEKQRASVMYLAMYGGPLSKYPPP
jgi:hypothetical protein